MTPMTLAEVAAAVGGRLDGADPHALVTAPLTADSRDVAAGGLFAALAGERADGHDFAPAAVAAGAVAVLAGRSCGAPAVLVDDVLAAVGRLAAAALQRLPGVAVVGVTGSSGKTTTKDLMAAVLSRRGRTVAPPGSHNNELGMPMTVLRADDATRHLVLEYSARGIGHIRYLTGIAPPRVAAVLNVGSAHLGEFGSREAIAQAKGELVEALPADGVALLNADDPLVAAMRPRTGARVLTFGRGAGADIRATGEQLDELGRPRFELYGPSGSATVRLRLHGAHQVSNALAAAGAALALGMSEVEVAAALGAAEPASRWRMEVSSAPDGVTVVNDAYNANPESTRAALDALVAIAGGRRRTWAVLGQMLELGEGAAAEHEGVGRYAADAGVEQVLAVGAEPVAAGAGTRGRTVPDVDAAVAVLRAELRPGDVVLVKASRAAGLERVAEAVLAGVATDQERSENR